jgi:DNA-binding NarL/FixJ family response regulator
MGELLRIAVADDNVLLRAGIVRILEQAGWMVSTEVGTAEELIAAVRRDLPDVAVVDIRMPPGDSDEGIRATHQIRMEFGERVAVLVLSQYLEPDFAMRLLEDGARGVGYLLKDRVADAATFTDAVRRVAAGGQVIDPAIVTRLLNRRRRQDPLDELTAREREVLQLIARGYRYKEIAASLHLSVKTVESHVSSVLRKLQLSSRHELTRWAAERRMI